MNNLLKMTLHNEHYNLFENTGMVSKQNLGHVEIWFIDFVSE